MQALFLDLVNMSISASWLVLAVVLLRQVLKSAPKALRCVLWGLVGLRLVWPFSWESVLSLVPSTHTIPQDILTTQTPALQTGIPALNQVVNPVISQTFAPTAGAAVTPMWSLTDLAANVWVAGMGVLAVYTLVSCLRIRARVAEAVPVEGSVWLCDRVESPFIFGLFRPRIYLPSDLKGEDAAYVVAHERAHLARRDHWWKPLGFALLTVYWFNPVLWLAYVLLCRDIELACDEKVIRDLGAESKKAYSTALINCSVSRQTIAACPLAFGEVGVAARVKSVLHYKKPAFWITLAAVAACIAAAACFLTDPPGASQPGGGPHEPPEDNNEGLEVLDFYYDDSFFSLNTQAISFELEEYPGVTFLWTDEIVLARTAEGGRTLYAGMPVWSVFLLDLTGDGKRELCSTVSIGSGMVDSRVVAYDYAAGTAYELAARGTYDYALTAQNGQLWVIQSNYAQFDAIFGGQLALDGGVLTMTNAIPREQLPWRLLPPVFNAPDMHYWGYLSVHHDRALFDSALSSDQAAQIFGILNTGNWISGTVEYGTDYTLNTDQGRLSYYSAYGVIVDPSHNRTLVLSASDRALLKQMLPVAQPEPGAGPEPAPETSRLQDMPIECTDVFSISGRGLTPEQAAMKLAVKFLDDMMEEDARRAFRMTHYENPSVAVFTVAQLHEQAQQEMVYDYGFLESELQTNGWLVEITADYQWKGVCNLGVSDGSADSLRQSNMYQGSPVDFLMWKEDSTYYLQSRWDMMTGKTQKPGQQAPGSPET